MKQLTKYLAAFVLIGILTELAIVMQPVDIPDEWIKSGLYINELYINDSGERSVTWDYNYGGKEWKYWMIINSTCHKVECECAKNTPTPCMAYCMECETIKEKVK